MNGAQLFQPILEAVPQPDGFSQQQHSDLPGHRLCCGAALHHGGLRGAGPHRGGLRGASPHRGGLRGASLHRGELRGAGPHCKVLSSIPGFYLGFPGGSDGKESACNAGRNQGSIPASGRSPGQGNGNPLLENPRDRGAWRATVHGITESQT